MLNKYKTQFNFVQYSHYRQLYTMDLNKAEYKAPTPNRFGLSIRCEQAKLSELKQEI